MSVALRLVSAHNRRGARRDHNFWRGLRLSGGHSLVDRVMVVGAVRGYALDRPLHLGEQIWHLARVVTPIVGQRAGDDLSGAGVDRDVQLAPRSSAVAVLLAMLAGSGAMVTAQGELGWRPGMRTILVFSGNGGAGKTTIYKLVFLN